MPAYPEPRINDIASTDPGVSDDILKGYGKGSTWSNNSTNKIFHCYDGAEGAAVWVEATGTWTDTVAFAGTSGPYISQSLGASYSALCRLPFRGTDVLGTLSSIKVVKQASGGSPTHSIRIYDITNSLVIAEVTGLSSVTLDILDMGTLSNLPAGAAVFEIQLKRDSGGAVTVDFSAVEVQY